MTIVAKNSPSKLKSEVLPDDSDGRTAENDLLSMVKKFKKIRLFFEGQNSENEHGGTGTKTEISTVNHSNIVDDYKYPNIVTNIGYINGGNIAIKSAK